MNQNIGRWVSMKGNDGIPWCQPGHRSRLDQTPQYAGSQDRTAVEV